MINKLYLFIILLFASGLFSCSRKQTRSRDKSSAPVVDVIIAKKVNVPVTIEVNGSALSEEMIELHPEVNGRLVYLNIPDGASVTAGTVLAKINDADLQAELEQQKVQLELAVKTEHRLKQLLAVNGVNQSDYDAAISQLNSIQANIKVLEAQIDKTVIKAPFNGRLGLRLVSPGAYVTPQTILGTLQEVDRIKIDFTVPETYSNLVKVGKKVTIRTNESKTKETAVISAIEPQIDVNTRNLKVRARLESDNIRPGSFVKVIFDKNAEGIVVPSNAIIPEASSNQVVVIKSGKAVFTNVETGLRTADIVELTSGVIPGDSIVVTGVLFVRPEASVSIRKVITDQFTDNQDAEN